MKIFLYVLAWIVGLISIIFFTVSYFTSDATKISKDFFENIKQNRYEESYKLTSDQFKEKVSLEDFIDFSKSIKIDNYSKIVFNTKSISNWVVDLKWNIINHSGQRTPIELSLSKINWNWEIQFVDIKFWLANSNKITLPTNEEISQLVNDTISNYITAFNSNDTSYFYNNISDLRKREITIEELDELLFKPIKNQIQFSWEYNSLIYTKDPYINENWVLIIEWYFTQPVIFSWTDLKLSISDDFLKENWVWKLSGLGFHIN